MDFFLYNNTTYEVVDNYNFINNQKISEIHSDDSCYYNLPMFALKYLNKK